MEVSYSSYKSVVDYLNTDDLNDDLNDFSLFDDSDYLISPQLSIDEINL